MTDKVPGQSMDAILASIRRIMADPAAAPADDAPEDVLELSTDGDPVPAPATPAPAGESLLSGSTAEATRAAMAAALPRLTIDPEAGANTLDGLVREMLRPMLKQWLDAHLPELVERVVTREIARLGDR